MITPRINLLISLPQAHLKTLKHSTLPSVIHLKRLVFLLIQQFRDSIFRPSQQMLQPYRYSVRKPCFTSGSQEYFVVSSSLPLPSSSEPLFLHLDSFKNIFLATAFPAQNTISNLKDQGLFQTNVREINCKNMNQNKVAKLHRTNCGLRFVKIPRFMISLLITPIHHTIYSL